MDRSEVWESAELGQIAYVMMYTSMLTLLGGILLFVYDFLRDNRTSIIEYYQKARELMTGRKRS